MKQKRLQMLTWTKSEGGGLKAKGRVIYRIALTDGEPAFALHVRGLNHKDAWKRYALGDSVRAMKDCAAIFEIAT